MKYCINCMEATEEAVCPVCGKRASDYQPLPHHLMPGTVLNGRYVIGRVLGEGGFGITYVGFDTNLEVKVAIKEYYPYGIVNRNNTFSNDVTTNVSSTSSTYEKGKTKFHEEAKMLARFSDLPNIVAVKDFFPLYNTEYIVMEYLEEKDLKDHLEKTGKMSFEEMYRLIEPIMSCLSKVHQKNLIHRDISPSNIMILRNGRVKLLDFGAARTSNVTDEKSLSVMLKPGYAPYEQYSSKGVQGPWTDIYALAATMYKMLTAETPETATDRVLSDEIKSIRSLNPTVTEEQEKVIFKAMAIMKQNRYQSVEEFKNACAAVLNTSKAQEPVPVTVGAPADARLDTDAGASQEIQKTRQQYKTEWVSTFNETVKRLVNGTRTITGNYTQSASKQPRTVTGGAVQPEQNRTQQGNTAVPSANAYGQQATNMKAKNTPSVKKPKAVGKIAWFIAIPILSVLFSQLGFEIKYDEFELPILKFNIIIPIILTALIAIALIFSTRSHKKTGALNTCPKKPLIIMASGIIGLSIICLIGMFSVYSTIDMDAAIFDIYPAEKSVLGANFILSGFFTSLYYGLHYLICFFIAKKNQKR